MLWVIVVMGYGLIVGSYDFDGYLCCSTVLDLCVWLCGDCDGRFVFEVSV